MNRHTADTAARHADFTLVDEPAMYRERMAQGIEAAGFSVLRAPQPVQFEGLLRHLHPRVARMAREALALPGVLGKCIRTPRSSVQVVATMQVAYLTAAWMCGAVGLRRPVYLVNFYIHSLSRPAVFRGIMRVLLTDSVGMSVQSPGEQAFYSMISNRARVDCAAYGLDKYPRYDPGAAFLEIIKTRYVFAGGYTNRDYYSFIAASRRLPEVRFVLACSRHNSFDRGVPSNVTVVEDTPREDFQTLLAHASVVVVPLLHEVGASGQMVALAAMSYGIPVVYTDFSVIAQYFVPGVTGIPFPQGNVDKLASAIVELLDTPERARDMGTRARSEFFENYTADKFYSRLAQSAIDFRSAINTDPGH